MADPHAAAQHAPEGEHASVKTYVNVAIALALIITVLVVKPAGLFGRPIVKRV